MPHEGSHLYYAKDGTLYVATAGHPMRSKDNGSTFTLVDGSPSGIYSAVQGDGTRLYIQPNGFQNAPQPFFTSQETDGSSWTAFNGGGQAFNSGPMQMAFDSANGIVYAALYNSGVWALKTN
jgi:hypothetical protein